MHEPRQWLVLSRGCGAGELDISKSLAGSFSTLFFWFASGVDVYRPRNNGISRFAKSHKHHALGGDPAMSETHTRLDSASNIPDINAIAGPRYALIIAPLQNECDQIGHLRLGHSAGAEPNRERVSVEAKHKLHLMPARRHKQAFPYFGGVAAALGLGAGYVGQQTPHQGVLVKRPGGFPDVDNSTERGAVDHLLGELALRRAD